MNGRPNDVRGFIHRRIFGGIRGAIGGILGGPAGIIGGALGGFVKGGGSPVPQAAAGCPPGFQLTARGCVESKPARVVPVPGFRGAVERLLPGGRTGFQLAPSVVPITSAPPAAPAFRADDFGDAVVGRYGAAIEPATRDMEVRVCPRGTVLGADGLCYNRRDIRNSERFWPRGRRPLLTGGEMRCISVAASAAKKLQTKQKQLEALGMLKKPQRRSVQRLLPSGHHAHVAHDGSS